MEPEVFLSTPLREGRLESSMADVAKVVFLSTPLREGRRNRRMSYIIDFEFLSTPLREGRPPPWPTRLSR